KNVCLAYRSPLRSTRMCRTVLAVIHLGRHRDRVTLSARTRGGCARAGRAYGRDSVSGGTSAGRCGAENAGHDNEAWDALDAVGPASQRREIHQTDAAFVSQYDVWKAGNVGHGCLWAAGHPAMGAAFGKPQVLVQNLKEVVGAVPSLVNVQLVTEHLMRPRCR